MWSGPDTGINTGNAKGDGRYNIPRGRAPCELSERPTLPSKHATAPVHPTCGQVFGVPKVPGMLGVHGVLGVSTSKSGLRKSAVYTVERPKVVEGRTFQKGGP